ncbi:MAG: response regulator transcription factor [Candidatus Bipolaricaulota bacterium]|nr:response regulator transcription factor [Candidatus Bipolaricaulota bacterium]
MDAVRVLVCHSRPNPALVSELEKEGYDVEQAECGEGVSERVRTWKPDLILLELSIPGQRHGGWKLLGSLRDRPHPPAIVVLTSLSRLDDRVRALNAGADDVILEPCDTVEVKARVRAVLRRTHPNLSELSLRIDDQRKQVWIGERCVALSPKEYSLVSLLASSPGQVFSSDDIVEALWLRPSYATGQDAQKYVYLLRRKIERDPTRPEIILTVRGFGYRLAL